MPARLTDLDELVLRVRHPSEIEQLYEVKQKKQN